MARHYGDALARIKSDPQLDDFSQVLEQVIQAGNGDAFVTQQPSAQKREKCL